MWRRTIVLLSEERVGGVLCRCDGTPYRNVLGRNNRVAEGEGLWSSVVVLSKYHSMLVGSLDYAMNNTHSGNIRRVSAPFAPSVDKDHVVLSQLAVTAATVGQSRIFYQSSALYMA
jgi:hypothetical protein